MQRTHLILLVSAWLVSCVLHVGAFTAPHDEGDEVVYQTLAAEMNWDLSHYTTRDHPQVRQFAFTTYRLPLFPHPPLYPLILKVGRSLGHPVGFGIGVSLGVMGLLLGFAGWTLRKTPARWALVAYAGIAFGPLLLYSTARLHTDGLMGALLACAVVATLEATTRGRPGWIAAAGALWVATLNLRYNAPLALPLLVLAQAYGLWSRASRRGETLKEVALVGRNWMAFALISALVLTLGLQHFYRVYFEYGTIWPWEFIQLDLDAPNLGQLQLYRQARPRLDVVLALLLVFPALLVFATPWTWRIWREDLRAARPGAFFALAFVFCFLCQLALLFNQLRYFAVATPFLYLCAPWILRRSRSDRDGPHRLFLPLAAITLFCMVGTALHSTVRNPEHPGVDPFLSAALDALLDR